ncbi:hypothetical protein MKW92_027634 [Papaver armeniacum]|nr:hypothetical protein MKW92_027634 [Papaver armeniacum]
MIHDSVDSLVILRGLEILAFPCNQFRAQEPGNNQQIVEFACALFKAKHSFFCFFFTTLQHQVSTRMLGISVIPAISIMVVEFLQMDIKWLIMFDHVLLVH